MLGNVKQLFCCPTVICGTAGRRRQTFSSPGTFLILHNVPVLHQQSEGIGILHSTARPHPFGALSASHHPVHTYGCLAETNICPSVPMETSPPPSLPQWRWQEELTQTKSRTRNHSMDLGTGPHNKSTVGSVSLASHHQHYCCDNTEAFWFPLEQSILASWLCFGEMSNNLSNATSMGQRILGCLRNCPSNPSQCRGFLLSLLPPCVTV